MRTSMIFTCQSISILRCINRANNKSSNEIIFLYSVSANRNDFNGSYTDEKEDKKFIKNRQDKYMKHFRFFSREDNIKIDGDTYYSRTREEQC